jgi:hypothetical protein
MAVFSGTNVVNDGLVFHFDLENSVKSFKGKPTSNLLAGTNLLNWSGTSGRGADTTVLSETYNGGTIWHLEDAGGVDPDVSVDNYYMYNSYGPVSEGEQYTLSLDVKVLQKSNIPNGGATNAIWVWYAQTTEYVYIPNLPLGEWTRVHVTCTAGSTYNYLIPRIDYDSNIIEIANIQFESGPIATKYINGIRLDTASIVDVSPTRGTITAANLTYRQDDTPTFDGANDYLDLGYRPDLLTDSKTNEAWVNASTFVNWHGIVSNMSSWGTGFSLQIGSVQNIAAMIQGIYLKTSWSPSTNTWYHIVATRDGTTNTNKLYVNGILEGTLISPVTYRTNAVTRIGCFYTSPSLHFPGEISQVKIYNKALTEAEIRQNFEATRSRYGI